MALEPVDDTTRASVVAYMRDLVSADRLTLERFDQLTTATLVATTTEDLDSVLADLPPCVRYTPEWRRFPEPMVLRSVTGNIRMTGQWQVPAKVQVHVTTGGVLLDFSEAEFDAPIVDLDVTILTGNVRLVVPPAIGVQVIEAGAMRNELGGAAPLPGAPLLRLRSRVHTGGLHLMRPKPPKSPRRRLFRRRSIAAP